jgi:hypothetical protein
MLRVSESSAGLALSISFHLFRSLSFLSVLEYQVSIGSLSLGDRAAEPVFHRYVDPVFQTSDAAQRIRMRQGRSWSLILQLDLYMTYDYDLYTMYIADDCSGLQWIAVDWSGDLHFSLAFSTRQGLGATTKCTAVKTPALGFIHLHSVHAACHNMSHGLN